MNEAGYLLAVTEAAKKMKEFEQQARERLLFDMKSDFERTGAKTRTAQIGGANVCDVQLVVKEYTEVDNVDLNEWLYDEGRRYAALDFDWEEMTPEEVAEIAQFAETLHPGCVTPYEYNDPDWREHLGCVRVGDKLMDRNGEVVPGVTLTDEATGIRVADIKPSAKVELPDGTRMTRTRMVEEALRREGMALSSIEAPELDGEVAEDGGR